MNDNYDKLDQFLEAHIYDLRNGVLNRRQWLKLALYVDDFWDDCEQLNQFRVQLDKEFGK